VGSSTPQGRQALALSHLALLRSVREDAVRSLIHGFRSSIPRPHIPLSNASSATSRPPSHGSGPGWFAIPYLCDFFPHCSPPVYPDAIPLRSYSPLRLPDWPPPFLTTFGAATPNQSRASLPDLRSPSRHAVLTTPVDRIRCSLAGEWRVPAPGSSLSVLPSPFSGRVGFHSITFEACSSFPRVTACRVAHLPYVSFIARLHPSRFPGSGARKLPSSTNHLLGWVLPPLVTCAVEAHPRTAFGRHVCSQAGGSPMASAPPWRKSASV